jgi:hypothetical protein
MPILPQPKLPQITTPTIRGLPTIPHVGCAGGHGTTYLGEQFGDLPDLNTILHIKTVKKALNEQIYALLKGELPFATRPPIYDARMVQLTSEVADLVVELNDAIGKVTDEANAAITFVNQKVGEMNAAKNLILAVPASARSTAQTVMLQRYQRYVGSLNAQANRLQSTIACVSG